MTFNSTFIQQKYKKKVTGQFSNMLQVVSTITLSPFNFESNYIYGRVLVCTIGEQINEQCIQHYASNTNNKPSDECNMHK